MRIPSITAATCALGQVTITQELGHGMRLPSSLASSSGRSSEATRGKLRAEVESQQGCLHRRRAETCVFSTVLPGTERHFLGDILWWSRVRDLSPLIRVLLSLVIQDLYE